MHRFKQENWKLLVRLLNRTGRGLECSVVKLKENPSYDRTGSAWTRKITQTQINGSCSCDWSYRKKYQHGVRSSRMFLHLKRLYLRRVNVRLVLGLEPNNSRNNLGSYTSLILWARSIWKGLCCSVPLKSKSLDLRDSRRFRRPERFYQRLC